MFPIELEPNLIVPIKKFLTDGTLSTNRKEARKVKIRAIHFCIIDGMLYNLGFCSLYLKCLTLDEVDYVLIEINRGVCGNHSGLRILALKIDR